MTYVRTDGNSSSRISYLPGCGADRSEPMEAEGLVTKAGLDATAKAGDRVEGVKRARPPASARQAARDWFQAVLAPERRTWLAG